MSKLKLMAVLLIVFVLGSTVGILAENEARTLLTGHRFSIVGEEYQRAYVTGVVDGFFSLIDSTTSRSTFTKVIVDATNCVTDRRLDQNDIYNVVKNGMVRTDDNYEKYSMAGNVAFFLALYCR